MIRSFAVNVRATDPKSGERTDEVEIVKAKSQTAAKRAAIAQVAAAGYLDCKALSVEPHTPWGETCGDAATATGMYDRY